MKTRIVIDRERLNEGLPAVVVVTQYGVHYVNEVSLPDGCKVTSIDTGGPDIGSTRVWVETEGEVFIKVED